MLQGELDNFFVTINMEIVKKPWGNFLKKVSPKPPSKTFT